ncbi:VanW family protein [Pseudonocardia kujensis]|uniref:VanW family protein n=1 Tax=Pseudonocardia kujensis TaxID=1128675 RepID=UPI001E4012FA|nr:VanW family protein [Pseudonocardia kujensis]MCE0765359.1 VanW family protein [Pseudonocardia kujensis]
MPERQPSPGEVDEQRTGGGGNAAGSVTDGPRPAAGPRTDSPRGDALFSPAPRPTPQAREQGGEGAGATGAAATAVEPITRPSPRPKGAAGEGAEAPAATSSSNGNGTAGDGNGVAHEANGAVPGAGNGAANGAGANGAAAGLTRATGTAAAGDTAAGTGPGDDTNGAAAQATGPGWTAAADSSGIAAGTPAPTTATPTPSAGPAPAANQQAAGSAPVPDTQATGPVSAANAQAPGTDDAGSAVPAPGLAPAGTPIPAPTPADASSADTATPPAGDQPAPAGSTGTPGSADERPTAVHPTATGWSAEDTQVLPRAGATAAVDQPTRRLGAQPVRRPGAAAGPADPPTEQFRMPTGGATAPTQTSGTPPTGDAPAGSGKGGGGRRKPLLIVAGVVAVLGLLYVADLVVSAGNVPRGVTVAGLELGGLSKADARQRLQDAIEPRSSLPVQITAGPVQSRIDPKAAGLEVDYEATIDQAGEQPLNPITRITSFFSEHEAGVINKADERSVTTALEQLKPVVDQAPVEGNVRFEGTTPVAVPPVPGQTLDLAAAVGVLEREWASGAPVALPLIPQPTVTTDDDVQQAIEKVAKPAVSAPLTIKGEGADAVLQPADIATALTFRADAAASPRLVPEINDEALKEVASPQLAATEKPARDASLDFSSGTPTVVPSQDGRGIDYDKTLENVVAVLTGTGERSVVAVYADQKAELTTEKLSSLGITGEISSFSTGGFAADSGQNIKRAADQINGTIVQPGETFSLNARTNPRNAANGYVEAGIIENGHSARGIGGGVSQVATTLYNAAYFAGMVDVAHKEHSFYISRYPVAREATVFDDLIDLKFRNDGPTGVLIQTFWTPSSLTVKMFGTKRYEVTSETGPRTNPTEPQTITVPPGQACTPSKGAPGFTATDTRVMRNLETGEVTRKTRTVKYNPSPNVICG